MRFPRPLQGRGESFVLCPRNFVSPELRNFGTLSVPGTLVVSPELLVPEQWIRAVRCNIQASFGEAEAFGIGCIFTIISITTI